MDPQERRRIVLDLLSLPETPKHGRGRLIGIAMELFYYNGINPVGLDRVLAEATVSKTTFYKHFASKDELVVATIETRDTWQLNAWKRAVEVLVGKEPRAQLLALVDVLDLAFNAPSFRGCQFINAAVEFPNPHDPIHRAAVHHKRANRDWIRDLAKEAGAKEPEAFADAYTMLFEGTLVMRMVHQRHDAAAVARPHFQRMLDEYVPTRALGKD
jgi:AcrR family transcriptional regulator